MVETTEKFYAVIVFVVFIAISLIYSVKTSRKPSDYQSLGSKFSSSASSASSQLPFRLETGPTGRRVFGSICAFVALTFLIDVWWLLSQAAALHVDILDPNSTYWAGTPRLMYLYSSLSLFAFFGISLNTSKHGPGVAHLCSWIVSLIGEVVIMFGSFLGLNPCNEAFEDKEEACFDAWAQGRMVICALRTVIILGVCCILFATLSQAHYQHTSALHETLSDSHSETYSHHHEDCEVGECDETTGLLTTNECDYGSTKAPATTRGRDENAGFYRPKKIPQRSWFEYLRSYSVFWQYVWPKGNLRLQFRVLICFMIILVQRAVNVLIPWQMGQLMDCLQHVRNSDAYEGFAEDFFSTIPWLPIAILDFLFMFQGSAGVLGAIRQLLWIDVSQFSYKGIETAAFRHVHGLSLDFHLGKKTGEVLSALNKGASINNFLEQVTFNLFPMLFDLIIGVYFFSSVFDGLYGTIVCVNTIWYVWLSINLSRARADQRREMTNADREEEAVKNDSITSYETVKYFNAEEFEYRRYEEAIDRFQRAEANLNYETSKMTFIQAFVFSGGLSLVIIVGCWQLAHGHISGGRFVTLLSYMLQLQNPLNFFNQFYRTMQQALISGERLLELFNYRPTVVDKEDAEELKTCKGHITWENVNFAYADKTTALKNLSFDCPSGSTTAFVGESGGGKSTVFRLMFRYYNAIKGEIKLDGVNMQDLSIDSVRQHIGVVPQETILFNETLMFNLRYANPTVTDDEVYEACRAAKIHDKIMTFPEKYNTKVGERGMRLSGGEKQRVAIARTILKNPRIILLDEATSALDSHTEQQIQTELAALGVGRTMMIIAHRLSTITHADQIIVLHKGEVSEKGTHDELIHKKGLYASMWERQIQAEKAAEQTRQALRREQFRHLLPSSCDPSDGYSSASSTDFQEHEDSDNVTEPPSPPTTSSPEARPKPDAKRLRRDSLERLLS
ncbi:ATP-binding cassette-type vacuolar membrane transporter Hmt1 [Ceratocystis pirilliformis]|uniref:ATP-binding cassette-type vacuolar membrane transporter Hmt1 n=1 Tax=Ceratocystis pirilliformis TaxID=259994 RepID=A0ABR3YPZ6_9PEZI